VNELYWHYTARLKEILESGVILPATANVPEREIPIVWFSTNQDWEKTVTKVIRRRDGTETGQLSRDDLVAHGFTCARIGVSPETAPHHWVALKRIGRINNATARGLYSEALKKGADPMEWRGTIDPVMQDKWLAIEIFNEGQWIRYERDEANRIHKAT
jgi:hypothetical protein